MGLCNVEHHRDLHKDSSLNWCVLCSLIHHFHIKVLQYISQRSLLTTLLIVPSSSLCQTGQICSLLIAIDILSASICQVLHAFLSSAALEMNVPER